MKGKKVSIGFYGGTEAVTGSNFLFKTNDEKEPLNILIDCGLEQGEEYANISNYEKFPFSPQDIHYLFITHPHIDHVGRIPKLVKDGFSGKIYSTAPTREIAQIMLTDSIELLKKEAEKDGKDPIYDAEDVESAMELWDDFPYEKVMDIGGGVKVRVNEVGHTLGSVMYIFEYNGKKIAFSGDLGNSPTPLLKDANPVSDVDYLVMESVYGDRNHEDRDKRREILRSIIKDSTARGGVLLIPAFSLERTQEVLYEIERMMEEGELPLVPVYVDSPLAIKITAVYKKYEHLLNKAVNKIIKSGNQLFAFPQLHFTITSDQSKTILKSPNPKIIIAGSGMSNGGRILHHEKHFLPDRSSTLLLIGYQAVGTLGRRIQDGAKHIKIFGETVEVKAKVTNIRGYSAHMDSDHLVEYVEKCGDRLKKVFVVMGEPKSSLFLVQRLKDYLGANAYAPKKAEVIELEF